MTKFWIATSVAAAALAVGGCGKMAPDESASANMAEVSGTTVAPLSPGQEFANAAGSSDTFEIEASKLAAANGASPSVKAFATKMITAHTESTTKLKTAAAAATPAITPDPTLTAEQQQALATLTAANGAAFNKLYIAEQQAAHQKALNLLRAYSTSGDVPALKSFATSLAPTVAAHLNMANSLKP